jgi:hypothetical protein
MRRFPESFAAWRYLRPPGARGACCAPGSPSCRRYIPCRGSGNWRSSCRHSHHDQVALEHIGAGFIAHIPPMMMAPLFMVAVKSPASPLHDHRPAVAVLPGPVSGAALDDHHARGHIIGCVIAGISPDGDRGAGVQQRPGNRRPRRAPPLLRASARLPGRAGAWRCAHLHGCPFNSRKRRLVLLRSLLFASMTS